MFADLLMGLSVVFLVVMTATAIGAWLLWRRLVRANRVVPGRRSPAPLSWLWSWRAAARLHRRLRRAMQVAGYLMVPFESAPDADLVGVADTLAARSAHLDERLVAVSVMAPPWRGKLLRELSAAVAEVESSVCHLERVAVAWRTEIHTAAAWEPLPPLDLRSRLGAIEEALADVGEASAAGASRAGGHAPSWRSSRY